MATKIKQVKGTAASDTLVAIAGAGTVYGYDGDDHLQGAMDAANVLNGGNGNDILVGGTLNDKLYGGEGNDEIYAGAGDDYISTGAGNDYIVAGQGNDRVIGGAGFDVLDYADEGGANGIAVNLAKQQVIDTYGTVDTVSGIERIVGTEWADSFIGNGSANVFEGGAGDDTMDGAGGADTLNGGFGNDFLFGGTGNDVLTGGRGDDAIDGGKGSDKADYSADGGWHGIAVNMQTGVVEDTWGSYDTLAKIEIVRGSQFADWFNGSDKVDIFDGAAGDDVMNTNAGDDELYGAEGNDTLDGGAGTDFLEGGKDNDVMTGGGDERDVFSFYLGDGADVIVDFGVNDAVRLYNSVYATADEALAQVQYAVLDDGRDGMMLNTGDGTVFFSGVYALTASQFELFAI